MEHPLLSEIKFNGTRQIFIYVTNPINCILFELYISSWPDYNFIHIKEIAMNYQKPKDTGLDTQDSSHGTSLGSRSPDETHSISPTQPHAYSDSRVLGVVLQNFPKAIPRKASAVHNYRMRLLPQH